MIKAEILADSKNEFGNRITTMIVTFPRIILAEFNTHRMFSRNSASSRAIPFEKILKAVNKTPFIPMAWQIDHKGMQGIEYLTHNSRIEECEKDWLESRDFAIKQAKRLNKGFAWTKDENNNRILGIEDESLWEDKVTKQLCNRLLEPFMYHTVIVTATEWENFFVLRCPRYTFHNNEKEFTFRSKKDSLKNIGDNEPVEYETGNILLKDLNNIQWLNLNQGQAEIHMMALAEAMWDAMNESTPDLIANDEWHIPYRDKAGELLKDCPDMMSTKQMRENLVKISTVMCARVSYTTLDSEQSEWTYEKYIKKHDELLAANPKHMSPFEHCAKSPETSDELIGKKGNFRGFIQYRKMIPNENITKIN